MDVALLSYTVGYFSLATAKNLLIRLRQMVPNGPKLWIISEPDHMHIELAPGSATARDRFGVMHAPGHVDLFDL